MVHSQQSSHSFHLLLLLAMNTLSACQGNPENDLVDAEKNTPTIPDQQDSGDGASKYNANSAGAAGQGGQSLPPNNQPSQTDAAASVPPQPDARNTGGVDGAVAATDVDTNTTTINAPCGKSSSGPAAAFDKMQWWVPCDPASDRRAAFACDWDVKVPKTDHRVVPNTEVLSRMGGDPNVLYAVKIRIRGIVEPRTYLDKSGKIVAPDPKTPAFLADGTPERNGYSVYGIRVSQPARSYWLNAYASVFHAVFVIDYTATINVMGGAELTFLQQEDDNHIIRNGQGKADQRVTIPGLCLDQQPFEGNVVQLDVLSVTAVR
jgi:hypothetical protein